MRKGQYKSRPRERLWAIACRRCLEKKALSQGMSKVEVMVERGGGEMSRVLYNS